MAEESANSHRFQLGAAAVLIGLMLLAASPPAVVPLIDLENLLTAVLGADPQRPAWGWPVEASLIVLLGAGLPLWARRRSSSSVFTAAIGIAMALLLLGLLVRALDLPSLHLVAPALTVLAAALLCMPPRSRPEPAGAEDVRGSLLLEALRQGQAALQQRHPEKARQHLKKVPVSPDTVPTLYRLGVELQRVGQREQAHKVFARIARRYPKYRDVVSRERNLRPRESTGARAVPPWRTEQPALDTVEATPFTRRTSELKPLPSPPQASDRNILLKPGRPTRLGRYDLLRELGRGAMGVVYLARDPRVNRMVALKTIPLAEEFEPDDLSDAKARFFREAETAGRLNHPNIVTIYDAGEEEDLAYIAMEYVEGHHLSDHAKADSLLPPATVIDLVARVADALGYAHGKGVVHRDVKPANLMYHRLRNVLKITDFGIARLTDANRTRTGIVLGTPSFMSPEQIEGRPVGGHSDLFSLGIGLFQLLTGKLPFSGATMPMLMHAIANKPHATLSSVRPDLPGELDELLAIALAKKPHDRFASGEQMGQALRTVLESMEKS